MLKSAGITTEDVDHINMHSTSTPLVILQRQIRLKKSLEIMQKMNLNSTKSMTGHTLSAAGAIESLAAFWHLSWYIWSINIDNQDPHCDLNYTANAPVARELNYALNNAFGFGGHNSTLVFKRYEG